MQIYDIIKRIYKVVLFGKVAQELSINVFLYNKTDFEYNTDAKTINYIFTHFLQVVLIRIPWYNYRDCEFHTDYFRFSGINF